MGRIKTQLVKRITKKIMDSHMDEMTSDFEANKKKILGWLSEASPKIRNSIAGYATRLKKKGYGDDSVPVRRPSAASYDQFASDRPRGRRPEGRQRRNF